VLLKRGENNGIAVYVPGETILKEITAKIKLSQNFFFDLFREVSDRTSYLFRVFLSLFCFYEFYSFIISNLLYPLFSAMIMIVCSQILFVSLSDSLFYVYPVFDCGHFMLVRVLNVITVVFGLSILFIVCLECRVVC
jgi:hypothetical protein